MNLHSQLFNVSDPLNITFLSNVSFGYDYFIHDNLLYVCSNDLIIYNISIPQHPILLHTIVAYKGYIYKAYIEGDLLYLIYDGSYYQDPYYLPYYALAIYDISRPTTPNLKIIEEDFFNKPLYEVYVRDGNIYLTGEEYICYSPYDDNSLSFKILQLSFPFAQIAVKNDFLFMGSDRIYVYDIKNPSDPVQLSSFRGIGHAMDLAISGDCLYYANREEGIVIMDILSSFTSRISIRFGFDLSIICVGFAFAMTYIIFLNSKSKKKC